MTLQEKIEIFDGVKDHPNKEKLVFEIDGVWVKYLDLKHELYNYILKDPTNEFLYHGSQKFSNTDNWDTPISNQDEFLIVEREDCNNTDQVIIDEYNKLTDQLNNLECGDTVVVYGKDSKITIPIVVSNKPPDIKALEEMIIDTFKPKVINIKMKQEDVDKLNKMLEYKNK